MDVYNQIWRSTAVDVELLRLEDSVIISMANNPNFLTEFPFLEQVKQLSKVKKGCGTCGKSARSRINTINTVKQSIISLSADRKLKLKQMLRTKKVRLRLSVANRVTEYTF